MMRLCDNFSEFHPKTNFAEDGSGKLNGMTILRFAHISEDLGGGVEQYLHDLNRVLLKRNRMTIIQTYLIKDNDTCGIKIDNLGQGMLVWVPCLAKDYRISEIPTKPEIKFKLKKYFFSCIVDKSFPSSLVNRFVDQIGMLRYHSIVSNKEIMEMFDKYKLDLAVFHWINDDSEEVIRKTILNKIPFVIVNHFNNRRYNLKTVKRWVKYSIACGGVSKVGVPRYLRRKFVNLSDGIDTDFFRSDKAKPLNLDFIDPVIFLPSRITLGKGHFDAVKASALLRSTGIRTRVVFAGRMESDAFVTKLKSYIKKLDMQNYVIFAGQLNAPDLRNWYGASAVVILPSYSEGLGRALLEAQAMGKPVIAYDTGGVSEAIRNGMSGYILRKGDVRSLAAKIKELLSCVDRRKAMGRDGENFIAEKFSILRLAIRHEEFYLKSLSNAYGN